MYDFWIFAFSEKHFEILDPELKIYFYLAVYLDVEKVFWIVCVF